MSDDTVDFGPLGIVEGPRPQRCALCDGPISPGETHLVDLDQRAMHSTCVRLLQSGGQPVTTRTLPLANMADDELGEAVESWLVGAPASARDGIAELLRRWRACCGALAEPEAPDLQQVDVVLRQVRRTLALALRAASDAIAADLDNGG